ncbi:MAG: Wzz/FepE/Etk N-terminal domain-containing protein [Thermodesulfobacteriota bacterium]
MEEEDTIELIDLLRVVWKWKWMIILVPLVCAIAAGVISLKLPEVYEISMIIEPGVIEVNPNGQFIYLDSTSNIKAKIDSQAYNRKIYEQLKVDPGEVDFAFKTGQPKNANSLEVRLEANDRDRSIQALSALFSELTNEYKPYVDSRKSEFDQKIAMKKHQLSVDDAQKEYLEKEIAAVKANTNRIVQERDKLMGKDESNPHNLSMLIYTNIIQQNMQLYNDLATQLSGVRSRIEKMKSEVESLKIKKESVENIKMIQEPQSSVYPVKPKKTLNVALALVVGLFLSVFLAFFLEYLHKAGSYPESPPEATKKEPAVKNQE